MEVSLQKHIRKTKIYDLHILCSVNSHNCTFQFIQNQKMWKDLPLWILTMCIKFMITVMFNSALAND
jgi:hypothetical protein